MKYEGTISLVENPVDWDLDKPEWLIENPNSGYVVETDCREELVCSIGMSNVLLRTCFNQTPIITIKCQESEATEALASEITKWIVGKSNYRSSFNICEASYNALVFKKGHASGIPLLSTAAFILAHLPKFNAQTKDHWAKETMYGWYDFGFEYVSDAILTAMYIQKIQNFSTYSTAGVNCNGVATYLMKELFHNYYIFRSFFNEHIEIIRLIEEEYIDEYDEEDSVLCDLLHILRIT